MRIFYRKRFLREFKKLPREIAVLAKERGSLFQIDPFDSRLKTHKLRGKLSGSWAFWIDHRNRIIFEFAKDDIVWFYSVGDHDIYG